MKVLMYLLAGILTLSMIASVIETNNVDAVIPGSNLLVSADVNGDPTTGYLGSSGHAPISANGVFVAYYSNASNIVSGDTNGKGDFFVRNLKTNTTQRISVSSSGVQANDGIPTSSGSPLTPGQKVAISSNGRYVAFISKATNLIDGQTINASHGQVYLKDRKTGLTSLVSKKLSGQPGHSVSGYVSPQYVRGVSDDGRFVLWGGDRNAVIESGNTTWGPGHVYLTDVRANSSRLISVPSTYSGNGVNTSDASMSCDGSIIVFTSQLAFDSNDTNGVGDVFVVDIREGYSVKRLTNTSIGKVTRDVNISCNGQYVSFSSTDSALSSSVSSGDTNVNVYIYDRIDEVYTPVSLTQNGTVANGHSSSVIAAVSDDGHVAFSSAATNLITGANLPAFVMYFWNNNNNTLEALSLSTTGQAVASQQSFYYSFISKDGTKVVYYTPQNSVMNGTPMFVGAMDFPSIIASETGV